MFLHIFLYAGIVPFGVAVMIALIAMQFRAVPRVYWPLGTAFGFIAGCIALKNQGGIEASIASIVHPRQAADWMPLIVLLALGVSLLLAQSAHRWVGIGLAALLVLAAPLRLLCGNVRLNGEWSALQKLVCVCLLALILGAIWLILAYDKNAQTVRTRLVLLLVDVVGTAAALTISGVLVYGQACGALAAALAGTALASTVAYLGSRPSPAETRTVHLAMEPSSGFSAVAGIITFSLGGFIILGHFFADLSATSALLLFVSLAAAGGPRFDGLLRSPIWQHVVIRTVACLVPLAIAVTMSIG